ncbi:AAA family ATPase [Actinobacillus delphinicola]|uniref:Thymidine kinase n=1 Tax=Actinobacillus delphinicola TaxID=51161 RepID=A0A448TUW2_9PAST|nr:AAA family ATPase [Actinobacillus delphinicola]VEJ09723.1 thymidine kinase [Actinobacillus delphinicola]
MNQNALKQFMETYNWGQKQVAQHFGKSISTVSQYLRGLYNGDVSELDRKVDELIALYTEKATVKYNEHFVPTLVAKIGFETIRYAHASADINVIYGAAGIGKTQLLKQYAKEHSSAVLIEVDPSCTPKVLLTQICEKIGATARGSNHDLLAAILDKLENSDRVLLVDEAELLNTRSLEFLRRIHDKANIGVVLAGMPRLLVNLQGKNNELAQLYSRVGTAQNLGQALNDDDMALLIEQTLGTNEFNAPLMKAAKGNARRLSKLIRGVVRTAKLNERPINEALIQQFSKKLIN